MPWAQRMTTTVLRLNASCKYSLATLRLARPLYPQKHTVAGRCWYSAYAPTLLRHQTCCLSDMRRAGPSSHADVSNTRVSASSILEPSIALEDATSSSSGGSATSELVDTAYRVVNFYHLVDVPNPYQARLPGTAGVTCAACLHALQSCQVYAESKSAASSSSWCSFACRS